MPESMTTKCTAAHAEVSARVPKSSTRLQTRSPMMSEQRKQPIRNRAREPGPPPHEVEAEGPGADHGHEQKDRHAARHPHDPGADGQVTDADGGEELVLHGLRPDVEEHRVGNVELTHLYRRQRHRADEDE